MAKSNTVHDIAATLMQQSTDVDKQVDDAVVVEDVDGEIIENDDELTLDEGNFDDTEEEVEDAEEVGESDDETEEEGDGEEDASDGDDQEHWLDVNDDDVIEVMIDGELVTKTIKEAKQALSGEGAIDKRLKEATETRKQAQADHTTLLQQYQTAHEHMVNVIQQLDSSLFQQTIQKPDARLRHSDPDKYKQQKAEYDEEQERITEGRQALGQLFQQQQQVFTERTQSYQKEQAAKLIEAMPDLKNAEKAPKLLNSMREVARRYGFTDEEINVAMDHRYYLMVADLAKLGGNAGKVERKANTVKNTDGQRNKRPRKLRSGATALKAKARNRANQQKKVTDTARKTGKVKDVAQTLVTRG